MSDEKWAQTFQVTPIAARLAHLIGFSRHASVFARVRGDIKTQKLKKNKIKNIICDLSLEPEQSHWCSIGYACTGKTGWEITQEKMSSFIYFLFHFL